MNPHPPHPFAPCPRCDDRRRTQRWLIAWAVVFTVGMFVAHIVGGRFCEFFPWATVACNPLP